MKRMRRMKSRSKKKAAMMELVDILDLKSRAILNSV